MYEAVLFDLDGVLIDSRHAWYLVMDAAAREFGHPPLPRAEFDASFGQGVEADGAQFYPGTPLPELDAYFENHFLDHADSVEINADAAAVMRALAGQGTLTAVVTNTQSTLAVATVRSTKLAPDLVVGANDVPREKPAPDMVLLACERLGVTTNRAIMVGDSRFDREAAHAAGVRFVGFGIEGSPRIERLTELLALVRGRAR